jgi:cell wall-associated NlpC family hydrolase
LGNSYEPEKAGPDHFDCSGFVYYIFKSNEISIPRSSLEQSKIGNKLSRDELEKGDILFFDTHDRGHVNHSGIYLGDGKFIHSSSGKAYSVTISDLDKGFYLDKFRWGIRKIEK